ncbi:hypothetical protein MPUL_37590 [Mycolicibacterium pulveris]|uniref:Uncharacterized protein n=1 Tax=Mycolicibacterium pulveris TaxID=36813 RepID=A0A7I7UP54_MYCPV|nr:hypothetical protein MPUL_37590 [Mycolicibacterium pulveris]
MKNQNPKNLAGCRPRTPRFTAERTGTTTDKGSCRLGESSAPDTLRYAHGAKHWNVGSFGNFWDRGIEVTL